MNSERESDTTIAALATPPGVGGLSVIRVSGADTQDAVQAVFRGNLDPTAHPRQLCFGDFFIEDEDEICAIDRGLAVFFPRPHSYTGEDVAEFHLHGSPTIVELLLRELFKHDVTPAGPGEFTQRAFMHGKLDLAQAEAVAEIIHATGEVALRAAQEQHAGKLSTVLSAIGEPLRDCLAEIEAHLDFPEEEIAPDTVEHFCRVMEGANKEIRQLLSSFSFGTVLRDGFRILLAGRPNAGKSSLLNAILGFERAIVSAVAGTTRDVIEERVIKEGLCFVFCDSAGIREAHDPIEQMGVELARSRLGWADLIFFVIDSKESEVIFEKELLKELADKKQDVWLILNKVEASKDLSFYPELKLKTFEISTKTGLGIDTLLTNLAEEVQGRSPFYGEANVTITSERHRACLEKAFAAVTRALELSRHSIPALELVAAELRYGLNALDEIIGKTLSDDILGRIFSKFCIGK